MTEKILSQKTGGRRRCLAPRRRHIPLLFRQLNVAIDAAYRTNHPRLLDALLAAKLDLARARAGWPSYRHMEQSR